MSQFADDAVVIVESYAGVDGIVHKKLYGMRETSVTLVLRGKRLGGLQSPCSFLVDQMMRIFYVFLHNSTTNITCGSNKIAARP